MSVELMRAAPVPLDFTLDGETVLARKLPFRLAMRLGDGDDIQADVMAEIIMACTIKESGEPAFNSLDDILDGDSEMMVNLFGAISGSTATPQEAEKNLKAIQR